MAAEVSPAETLRYEETGRRKAAYAAFAGGGLLLAWLAVSLTSLNDIPRGSGFASSLARVGDGRAIGELPSLQLATFEYLNDRAFLQVFAGVLLGLSAVAASYALVFLARAARARADRFTNLTMYLPAVGGVMVLVGVVMFTLSGAIYFGDIASSSGTVAAVADVGIPGFRAAGDFLRFFGNLFLGLGFVLVALAAMRVGLLTRYMGIIGAFAGALVLLQGVPTYVMQTFWLIALGFLLLGVWPGGAAPPAWATGQAEPWPSPAEERAARQRAAGGGARKGAAPAPPEPEAVEARAASGKAHPSSKKKRKRR